MGHIVATWRIRLNPPCAAAMRPFVKLLSPLAIIIIIIILLLLLLLLLKCDREEHVTDSLSCAKFRPDW